MDLDFYDIAKSQMICALEELQQRIYEMEKVERERKTADKKLRESEARYRLLAENIKDVIWTVDLNLQFTYISPSVFWMLGHTAEEIKKLPQDKILPPPSLELARTFIKDELDPSNYGRRKAFRQRLVELELYRKDGSKLWVEIQASVIRDAYHKPVEILGMTRDITDRKRTEEKIRVYQRQLRSLAAKLSLTEEMDRRRIATDLHDNIGQTLAVSKIKLGQLQKAVGNPQWSQALDEVRKLIEQAIQYSRSLTSELSPPVLYELGFEAAVQWLLEKARKDHGLNTSFCDDGQPKPMSDEIRVVLFQAVRELLTNVAKHAQAREVKTQVCRDSDAIRVEVNDDGVGFDEGELSLNLHKKHAFGLFHIRERLDHLGGHFAVTSKPGCGTQVRLAAPLKKEG